MPFLISLLTMVIVLLLIHGALMALSPSYRRIVWQGRSALASPEHKRHIAELERDVNIFGAGDGWLSHCWYCEQMVRANDDDTCPLCGAGAVSVRDGSMAGRRRRAVAIREDVRYNPAGGALYEEHERLVDPRWRIIRKGEEQALLDWVASGEYHHNMTKELDRLAHWQEQTGHPLIAWVNEEEKRIVVLPDDRVPSELRPEKPRGWDSIDWQGR